MAGGNGDEDDGILGFQNPDAVQNADGIEGPAAGRLLGDPARAFSVMPG